MTTNSNKSNFTDKLKERWGITNTFQVIIILVVFACTGFSVLFAEEIIFRLIGIGEEKSWWLAILLFLLITLPLYNLLLLIYGFIFGQFRFFWNFEKRFFGRMTKPFRKKITKS
jgi:membrane protease YdiL (CAAX protease family)